MGEVESQPPCTQMYFEEPAWARRWPPPAEHVTVHTDPTGKKPLPRGQSAACCAFWSETEGMFAGQPRVLRLVLGHERLADLTVSLIPADLSWALQLDWKGFRTFAHSWSQLLGSPFAHGVAAC